MLSERLTDPARLQDRRYIAEPKRDVQRARIVPQPLRDDAGVRHGMQVLTAPGAACLELAPARSSSNETCRGWWRSPDPVLEELQRREPRFIVGGCSQYS